MTALQAAALASRSRWTPPLSPADYDRTTALSREERRALQLIADRPARWPAGVAQTLSRLTRPTNDVLAVAGLGPGSWAAPATRSELLAAMGRERSSFWAWDREQWMLVVAGGDVNVRQLVIAVAYGLCGVDDLHWGILGFKCGLFARRVFGRGPVETSMGLVQEHLDRLGYSAQLRRPNLQRALFELMLAARSPLLEDLAERPDLLVELRGREQHNARRNGVEQLGRTLADMGLLEASPFRALPSREEWLSRSRAGERDVPDEWLRWAKRWFQTSTLSRSTRHGMYFGLVKIGRWLSETYLEHADPGSWTRELAAAWVARVDQMLVDEYSHAPNTDYMRRRSGGQLSPRTKAQLIWTPRRFFYDLQEREWIERRFDPRRAFELPRSIRALIGPDPRVIADEVWAKLMWAGLNLQANDLPLHATTGGEPWYPLELVRAVAMLWLFSGLRTDEIMRLRVGAIRWEKQHDADESSERRVCLLDVPTNKTLTALTKPVDPLVGDAIDSWERARPPQPRFTDRRRVSRLTSFSRSAAPGSARAT